MGEAFKHVGHSFVAVKGLPWPVCKSCGLVRLRNPLTDWCVRHGCNYHDAPGYRATVRRLTKV
jgi:hypothetical protein